MAALDFPASPSNGDVYENYVYDSTVGVWRRLAPSGILNALDDVTITSADDQDILRYDDGTSKWINEPLKLATTDGAVMVFDDAAARTTAIPSPVEGMVTYLKDLDRLEQFDGSNFVAVSQPGILQVVTATTSTAVSTTSTSFQTTGLSASITPSSSSSKILIITHTNIAHDNENGHVVFTVFRGTTADTNLGNGTSGLAQGKLFFGTRTTYPASVNLLDSPNTTSSTTYTCAIRTTNVASTARAQDQDSLAAIVLLEVSG